MNTGKEVHASKHRATSTLKGNMQSVKGHAKDMKYVKETYKQKTHVATATPQENARAVKYRETSM